MILDRDHFAIYLRLQITGTYCCYTTVQRVYCRIQLIARNSLKQFKAN